jgi:hypothetical protein
MLALTAATGCGAFLLGCTALHWAANLGRPDLVMLLLKYHARIDVKNNAGLTPFEVTEWDRRQVAQAAQGQATQVHADAEEDVTMAGNGASEPYSQPAAASSASGPAPSLICPKCTRAYTYQFRFDRHVAHCDGLLRSYRGRRKKDAASASSGAPSSAAAAATEVPQAGSSDVALQLHPSSKARTVVPVVASPAQKALPPMHAAYGAVAASATTPGTGVDTAAARAVAMALGLQYGLRMFANQWQLGEESGRAACKRLLFQQALNGQRQLQRRSASIFRGSSFAFCSCWYAVNCFSVAVDHGDDGDYKGVQRLVSEWHAAAAAGASSSEGGSPTTTAKMFPLCYRGFASAPLQVAVAYENNHDNAILKLLLTLPNLHYTQSGQRQKHRTQARCSAELRVGPWGGKREVLNCHSFSVPLVAQPSARRNKIPTGPCRHASICSSARVC